MAATQPPRAIILADGSRAELRSAVDRLRPIIERYLTVVGESHAWVEYWDGQWQAVDPTNDRAVGSAHVIVARGRDYADVPPLKGIYAGGHSEALGVSVEITQL